MRLREHFQQERTSFRHLFARGVGQSDEHLNFQSSAATTGLPSRLQQTCQQGQSLIGFILREEATGNNDLLALKLSGRKHFSTLVTTIQPALDGGEIAERELEPAAPGEEFLR